MSRFIEQARQYSLYHQQPMNWYTHMIGIPLIILSLFILLGFLHVVVPNLIDIKLSAIAMVALLGYYFWLKWQLALILTPIFIILLLLSGLFNADGPTAFALWSFFIILIIGIIMQLIGHLLEGKKPALMVNVHYTLLSPMFLAAELIFMAGWMTTLKESIYLKENELHEESHTEE